MSSRKIPLNISTRALGIVFGTNIAGTLLGAAAILITSRTLSVEAFGLFSLAITALRMLPILANLGLDTSVLTQISRHLKDGNNEAATDIIRASFPVRLVFSLIIGAATFFYADGISLVIVGSKDFAPLLRWTAPGLLCLSLFNYGRSVLWAYQRYRVFSSLQIMSDAIKLLATGLLALCAGLTPVAATIIYGFNPAIALGVAALKIPKKFFHRSARPRPVPLGLWRFCRWVYLSEIFKTILNYAPIFFIAPSLGKNATGIYGLATHLIYVFPIFITSLKAILLPGVGRFHHRAQFQNYLHNINNFFVAALAISLPVMFLSKPLITIIFGQAYAASAPVFNGLLLSQIATTAAVAASACLLTLERPNLVMAIDTGRLIGISIGIPLLLPRFGLMAAPIALTAVNLIALLATISCTRRILKRRNDL